MQKNVKISDNFLVNCNKLQLFAITCLTLAKFFSTINIEVKKQGTYKERNYLYEYYRTY